MITIIFLDNANCQKLHVHNEKISNDFVSCFQEQTGKERKYFEQVQEIKISGSNISCFDFLELFPNLKRIYFLECVSDNWENLHASNHTISIGLHNLKDGKKYLLDTSFLKNFPNLEYLYINMLGVSSLLELPNLQHLHTIMGVFRNENNKKEPFDFSSFQKIPALKIFYGYMAVDRHRISAESFIPIIKNHSLESFEYTQMYATENKKLNELIKQLRPSLINSTLPTNSIMKIRKEQFCQ